MLQRSIMGAAMGAAFLVMAAAGVLADDPPAAVQQPAADKLLLVHYMPWYQTPSVRGQWGGHWKGFDSPHDPGRTDAQGLPDIWSHFHPLIGPYDSTDPALVECHLGWMKLAGIDGVIVDWYGVAEALDYPAIHRGTEAMFGGVGGFGLQFAACYEDRVVEMMIARGSLAADGGEGRLREDIAWLSEHWFATPQYVKIDERPLLLNFGPIRMKDASSWNAAFEGLPARPAFFALHHLWRNAGADGGFTWIHWEPWKGEADDATVAERLRRVCEIPSSDPKQVIVSAFPGYQDVYRETRPVLEHRGGKTLRQSLAAALDSRAGIVQLVTWNDYGEGTMIEPTHEHGYTFLEIVQDAARERRGGSFPYTSADLRLPQRLYEARKAGRAPPAKLDLIGAAIRRGDCEAAAAALDKLP